MFNPAPVAADWDADGQLDLIVGREEGAVLFYRNLGQPGKPKLAEAEKKRVAAAAALKKIFANAARQLIIAGAAKDQVITAAA